SCQHDPSSAERRRAEGGGRWTGHDPPVGGHRVHRRSDLGPRAGIRARCPRGRQWSGLGMIDLTRYQDPQVIQRVIHTAKTIAIVGLSPNELRASHFVGYYLKRHGYRVIPVNPRETEVMGEPSFKSLADIPA